MAGPHVAGVVALMRSYNADLEVDDVKRILMETAVDAGLPGEDNDYGWGVIDAYRAVTAVEAEGDEAVGVAIIRRALEEPLRQIAANAGHEGAVVVARVREMEGDQGFNAQTDVYENLVEAGIIDPTKVVRCALQNAASIASLLLSTEAVICEMAAGKGEGRMSGGMPPGGGMY